MALPHRQQRQQDEIYCLRCHKRWDASEPAPECLSFVELTRRPEAPSRNGPAVQRSSLTAGPDDIII